MGKLMLTVLNLIGNVMEMKARRERLSIFDVGVGLILVYLASQVALIGLFFLFRALYFSLNELNQMFAGLIVACLSTLLIGGLLFAAKKVTGKQ